MKIYKTRDGILVQQEKSYYQFQEDWDQFVNVEDLRKSLLDRLAKTSPKDLENPEQGILAPIGSQELWATGVTYLRSKEGRVEESQSSGGGDFYQRVYEAQRPELFFKAAGWRVLGPHAKVRIRKDSSWDVPEPELALFINSWGQIQGYTISNDMSSRSIEGENPLYLPQAKCYDGAAALGPCIYVPESPISPNTEIRMQVLRKGTKVFSGQVSLTKFVRRFQDLAEFLFREMTFPSGAFLMTGTGIVPGSDFTLGSGDLIRIEIDGIGLLENEVE